MRKWLLFVVGVPRRVRACVCVCRWCNVVCLSVCLSVCLLCVGVCVWECEVKTMRSRIIYIWYVHTTAVCSPSIGGKACISPDIIECVLQQPCRPLYTCDRLSQCPRLCVCVCVMRSTCVFFCALLRTRRGGSIENGFPSSNSWLIISSFCLHMRVKVGSFVCCCRWASLAEDGRLI